MQILPALRLHRLHRTSEFCCCSTSGCGKFVVPLSSSDVCSSVQVSRHEVRGVLLVVLLPSICSVCPDREPGLQPWLPGHSEEHHVTIGSGQNVLLTASATVHSIQILNGGKLVVADSNRPILLRTRSILVGNGGGLHVGSPDCPYRGNFTISLFGRLDSGEDAHAYFGRKFLGVARGGTLEIHGRPKLSWTFLNATLHPGGPPPELPAAAELGEPRRPGARDPPGQRGVLQADRFDTHRSQDESRRLAEFVGRLEAGLIVVMLVNDEASKNLEESARGGCPSWGVDTSREDSWTFIVKKGDPSSAVEDHSLYGGVRALPQAKSVAVFESRSGKRFRVTASSQWLQEAEWSDCSPLDIQAQTVDGVPSNQTGDVIHKNDKNYGFVCLNRDQPHGSCHNYRVRFLCGKEVQPRAFVSVDTLSGDSILELADEPLGWESGDRVVVASSDFSMHQAEEFTLMPCPQCSEHQVKVKGQARFVHLGGLVDGWTCGRRWAC
ncbi:hypothetical protein OJAV_G00027660 [Oryzias javanicus]|uniref:G8 domain-containing protein n=1 Tax=Oryzias javanicus TaxID=123683 RepID=A0A437DJC5_ORYJA|nr:hypothetical protein OJAV_G00027660 [Oryzias javanicus]